MLAVAVTSKSSSRMRSSQLELDKACIDQQNIQADLRCLRKSREALIRLGEWLAIVSLCPEKCPHFAMHYGWIITQRLSLASVASIGYQDASVVWLSVNNVCHSCARSTCRHRGRMRFVNLSPTHVVPSWSLLIRLPFRDWFSMIRKWNLQWVPAGHCIKELLCFPISILLVIAVKLCRRVIGMRGVVVVCCCCQRRSVFFRFAFRIICSIVFNNPRLQT